ncbi:MULTISPECIES: hypothetical protein [Methylobacterium]|uniref:hypothetical protein n=1 Tax=Methylobacterium TaxID=407 RepID=UPI001FEFAC8F|nr:hypothetical protein [Methylobacterium sp. DB0501]
MVHAHHIRQLISCHVQENFVPGQDRSIDRTLDDRLRNLDCTERRRRSKIAKSKHRAASIPVFVAAEIGA